MKLLYRNGFTAKERRRAKIELRRNLMTSVLKLDEVGLSLRLNLSSNASEEAITRLKLILADYNYDERDDENCVEAHPEDMRARDREEDHEPVPFPAKDILQVVSDPTLQTAYRTVLAPGFKLPEADSAGRELVQTALPYVMQNIGRMCRDDYLPSDADCLHLRRHTTSVERIRFCCELTIRTRRQSVACTCTDIGGQAQEQTKWEQHAGEVDFILYVAALSDFNQTLPDGSNALALQLQLLAQVLRASCFADKNVIVLLNKADQLSAALEHCRLADFFPEFKGENCAADAEAFFRDKCQALLQEVNARQGEVSRSAAATAAKRQIQVVTTCALDSDLVNKVLKQSLSASMCSTLVGFGMI